MNFITLLSVFIVFNATINCLSFFLNKKTDPKKYAYHILWHKRQEINSQVPKSLYIQHIFKLSKYFILLSLIYNNKKNKINKTIYFSKDSFNKCKNLLTKNKKSVCLRAFSPVPVSCCFAYQIRIVERAL